MSVTRLSESDLGGSETAAPESLKETVMAKSKRARKLPLGGYAMLGKGAWRGFYSIWRDEESGKYILSKGCDKCPSDKETYGSGHAAYCTACGDVEIGSFDSFEAAEAAAF